MLAWGLCEQITFLNNCEARRSFNAEKGKKEGLVDLSVAAAIGLKIKVEQNWKTKAKKFVCPLVKRHCIKDR